MFPDQDDSLSDGSQQMATEMHLVHTNKTLPLACALTDLTAPILSVEHEEASLGGSAGVESETSEDFSSETASAKLTLRNNNE